MIAVKSGPVGIDADYRLCGQRGDALAYDASALAGKQGLASYHDIANQLHKASDPSADKLEKGIAESRLGADGRDRVVDTRRYPFSAICALRMIDVGGKGWAGTGCMISQSLVLTAGHNIYKHDRGGFVKHATVYPGLNGSTNSPPFPAAGSKTFLTVKAWTVGRDQEMDFGAIVLPTPLGKQCGYFSVSKLTDGTLNGLAVSVSGYPLDCPAKGTARVALCGRPASTQWADQGNITYVEPTRLRYNMDTTEGQSGAPVFAHFDDKKDPFQVVGVHNYGHESFNAATRINQAVFDMIVKWLKDSP